jgi:hypothetical protein
MAAQTSYSQAPRVALLAVFMTSPQHDQLQNR